MKMLQQPELAVDPARSAQDIANRFRAQIRVIDCKDFNTRGMTLLLDVLASKEKMGDVLSDLKKTCLFKKLYVAQDGDSRSLCVAVLDRPPGLSNLNENDKLTPRQREVLSKPISLGYYEFPRRIDITTLSEILRSAERKIMYYACRKFRVEGARVT